MNGHKRAVHLGSKCIQLRVGFAALLCSTQFGHSSITIFSDLAYTTEYIDQGLFVTVRQPVNDVLIKFVQVTCQGFEDDSKARCLKVAGKSSTLESFELFRSTGTMILDFLNEFKEANCRRWLRINFVYM